MSHLKLETNHVEVLNALAGRVAAGAIAEKYLKLAHGVEIIAFVSGVGKIHLPTTSAPTLNGAAHPESDDDTDETISPDYLELLQTVTREKVDSTLVRCPHAETAKRMEQVRKPIVHIVRVFRDTMPLFTAHPTGQSCSGLHRRHRHLRHP